MRDQRRRNRGKINNNSKGRNKERKTTKEERN
jgi:hypothetical protein